MISDFTYEGMRRVVYGGDDEIGGATFVPVCPKCGRFVKSDKSVSVNGFGEFKDDANASCKNCGRVQMPFEGYY